MADRSNIHVVPGSDGWAVRREGASRASVRTDTQAQAIDAARDIARREQGEVFIHGRDNLIRDRNSYGSDPYPPKG